MTIFHSYERMNLLSSFKLGAYKCFIFMSDTKNLFQKARKGGGRDYSLVTLLWQILVLRLKKR